MRPTRLQRRYWHLGTLFWIVYLLFDLPAVVRGSRSGARTTVQLTLLAVLVAAYLYVIWRTPADPPPPRRGLAVAAMAAVVAVLVLLRFPGQWAPLLLFVSLSLAVVLPRGPAVRAIALTAVATTALSLWQGVASSTALHGTQALIAGLGILGFLNILGLNLQLVAAQDELARMAVAQERMRFARDLHDLLGHSLSVIALKSELAGGLLPADPARAVGELRDIEQVARRALAEVREAVGGYRQVTLAGELGGARTALEATGVRAAVEDPPADLRAPVEEVLGWAVREATTNLLRHSGATRCRVHFEEDGGFRLRVELPLRGSPPHDYQGAAGRGPGHGPGRPGRPAVAAARHRGGRRGRTGRPGRRGRRGAP